MNYVPTSSSISAGICAGDTYSFGSQTLTTAGTYTRTIPNAQGCDSVITLTLSNLASTSSNITGTICFGGTLIFGSQTITAPGTYSRTIPNAAGCDSLITMTVTYQMMNTNVVQTGATLSVPVQTGATYSWLTCPQMTSIAGANSNSYTATNLTGSYAVVVSINGCSDTSTCYTVDQTGLNEVNLSSFVDVFPNPTSDVLKVESNSFNMISFKVLDLNGRVILSEQNLKAVNSLQFNTVNFENGTYILDLNTEYGSVKKVFIKQ
jgi:hypothetical protein